MAKNTSNTSTERSSRTLDLPVKVNAEEKAAILEIAKKHDRPMGYVARELMLRGLAAYSRDTLIKEPPAPSANDNNGANVSPAPGDWIEVPVLRPYRKKPEKKARRA